MTIRLMRPLMVGVIFLTMIQPSLMAESPKKPTLRTVRFSVSFIPNVQFSPLYIAQQKGFYAEEGLAVELEYGYENDFISLTAQGAREFVAASGDQIILARSQGLPITYIMKWYQRYPVGLMMPTAKNIRTVKDLIGKRVGLPGFFGASYIGWKALVYRSGLDETQVSIKQIGFTQAAALQQDVVDAAVVYIINEPIQMQEMGMQVNVIEVSDYIDLVSNGLAVGDALITSDPDLVQRMVRATRRGLEYAVNHPDEAFAASRRAIPEITDTTAPMQRKVLEASINLWKTDHYGVSSRKSWQESVEFMRETGFLNKPVDIDTLYTNQFVDAP